MLDDSKSTNWGDLKKPTFSDGVSAR